MSARRFLPAASGTIPDISKRQFGEGLWNDEIISFEEYIAFMEVCTIPPPLQAIIDTLPDDETGRPTPRKVATGLAKGASTYRRDDPLVDYVREYLHAQNAIWTPTHLDERWQVWGQA